MIKILKKAVAAVSAGILTMSMIIPAVTVYAEENRAEGAVTQFMDCFSSLPKIEELNANCWGAETVGERDQGNGLEDRDLSDYTYWDGSIIKADEKYYMFASRWGQDKGHGGWTKSQAIYAVSDNLYGPYEDKGPMWPDWCDGAGHNVVAFEINESDPLFAEGYRYGISISDTGMWGSTANGTLHIAKDIEGPWDLIENGNNGKLKAVGGFGLSNVSICVRHDGKYQATNRYGDIAIADSLAGDWQVKEKGLWNKVVGMPTKNVEDPEIWYSDGLYHIVANKWDTKEAFYMTSEDGITNWVRHSGYAYTPKQNFMTYEDGTQNNWTKLERPSVYIEDGTLKAMTFAVIDVEKEQDGGNDDHGSKILVIPFDGETLGQFAKTDIYYNPLIDREGINPIADSTAQSWQSEANKNYGAETFLQLQRNKTQGLFGEGDKPDNSYDCKIAYMKFDIAEYLQSDIESASLSLAYIKNYDNSLKQIQLRTALSSSEWEEGIGKEGGEGANGNKADAGTLVWGNQPDLMYDVNDIVNTTASSAAFPAGAEQTEIKIDVTSLLKTYISENPDATTVSFALSNEAGRIHIGSKEGGAAWTPKLQVVEKEEEDPLAVRTGIDPVADSTVQSWGNENNKNYGAETFLQMQRNKTQGLFGEGVRPNNGYDCKIAYIKYDISEYTKSNIDSANLSLVYDKKFNGSTNEIQIQTALSSSEWEEGVGKESGEGANGNKADAGTLIWENQPDLIYDVADGSLTVEL